MCMEWIRPDELIEVTPTHIRLRKKILRAVITKIKFTLSNYMDFTMNKHIVLLFCGLTLSSLSFAQKPQELTQEQMDQRIEKQVTAFKTTYEESNPEKQKEFFKQFLMNEGEKEFYKDRYLAANKRLKATIEQSKEYAEELKAQQNYNHLRNLLVVVSVVGCGFFGYKWFRLDRKCAELTSKVAATNPTAFIEVLTQHRNDTDAALEAAKKLLSPTLKSYQLEY